MRQQTFLLLKWALAVVGKYGPERFADGNFFAPLRMVPRLLEMVWSAEPRSEEGGRNSEHKAARQMGVAYRLRLCGVFFS